MVRVGNHSLELIDATTLQPLKEFTHDGETWVEGRPGNEYLVKITSHKHGSRTIAQTILVDGTPLSYIFQQGPNINLTATLGPTPSGGVSGGRDGNVGCQTFRFARPDVTGEDTAAFQHGSVKVGWWKALDHDFPTGPRYFGGWNESNAIIAPEGKKVGVGALKSMSGSSEVSVPLATSAWHATEFLYSATIKYCEAAGLVALGVISAPQRPLQATRKRKKTDASTQNVKAGKEAEIVDLASIKEEMPKSKLPCGPDNVVVID